MTAAPKKIDISDEDEGRRELSISLYPHEERPSIHFLASTRWGDVHSIAVPVAKGPELLEAIRAIVAPREPETVDLVAELRAERDRYRKALGDIQLATYRGHVCDDVAWFDPAANETLFDFIDRTLDPAGDAALRDMFVVPTLGAKLNPEYAKLSPRLKWGALAVNGLLGTDEPWIDDMDDALRAQEDELIALRAQVAQKGQES